LFYSHCAYHSVDIAANAIPQEAQLMNISAIPICFFPRNTGLDRPRWQHAFD
jgi:hypothetical protein